MDLMGHDGAESYTKMADTASANFKQGSGKICICGLVLARFRCVLFRLFRGVAGPGFGGVIWRRRVGQVSFWLAQVWRQGGYAAGTGLPPAPQGPRSRVPMYDDPA